MLKPSIKNPIGYSLRSHFGGIYKHTPAYSKIDNLHNTYVTELGIVLPKRGTHNWHHAFNYPEAMFSFLYADFGSVHLDKGTGALAHIQIDSI